MSSNIQKKIVPLNFETYISVISKAEGVTMFRNLYISVDGERKDATENGALSCAFFVSSLLKVFGYIKEIHATVAGTVKDLQSFGWMEITEPVLGCVIVWAESPETLGHKHVGFYIGDGKVISNDSQSGYPKITDWQFDGKRKVELILWKSEINPNK